MRTQKKSSKKTEMHAQAEGKTRPAAAKPGEWQRGKARSDQRVIQSGRKADRSSSR